MKTSSGTFIIRDLQADEAHKEIAREEGLSLAINTAKNHLLRTSMDPGWGIEARNVMYVPAGQLRHVDAIVLRPVSYGEPHEFGVIVYPAPQESTD